MTTHTTGIIGETHVVAFPPEFIRVHRQFTAGNGLESTKLPLLLRPRDVACVLPRVIAKHGSPSNPYGTISEDGATIQLYQGDAQFNVAETVDEIAALLNPPIAIAQPEPARPFQGFKP